MELTIAAEIDGPRRRVALATSCVKVEAPGPEPGVKEHSKHSPTRAMADVKMPAALTSAVPNHEPPRSTLPLMFLPW
jgi:hypothetical protein